MHELTRVMRHLFTGGRWRRSLTVVVAFAIGCALLSWWQFSRGAETAAENALIFGNSHAAVAEVDELLPSLGAYSASQAWRPVRLKGTYLTDKQTLVQNRVHDGDSGYEVLTPMRLADGRVFVLDRGWVQTGTKQALPDSVPAAPSGTVTVLAWLQGGEGGSSSRPTSSGVLASVDLAAVAAEVGEPTYTGAYGLVRSQTPAPASHPVQLGPEPVSIGTDEGTHLSYAIQWILFGLLGFAGLFYTLRRDLLDAGDPVITASDERRRARRAARGPTDEELEDSLVER